MDIRIDKRDQAYVWSMIHPERLIDEESGDENWMGDTEYYTMYQLGGVKIRAVYTVVDAGAEMDTDDFADWDNPDYLAVVCED